MLKGDEIFIGQGAHGKVYNNGDGTVTKVVQLHKKPYEELLPALYKGRKSIEGVAKAIYTKINYHVTGYHTMSIVKEQLVQSNTTQNIIERVVKVWEDSLVNSNNFFDFVEQYLKGNQKTVFRNMRSVKEFVKYLRLDSPLCVPTFFDFVDIVEELKAEGIYNVDWNVENFGVRASTGKLTMFELGEAKYKKK